MKLSALSIIILLVCCTASGQEAIRIEQIREKSKVINPIVFEAHKTIDSRLEPMDSLTFYQLFKDSKLLGRWKMKCCFYYAFTQEQVAGKKLNLLVIEREGHYRPYMILAVLDDNLILVDEIILANHFVDAGEALEISSTIKDNIVKQLTLDYNAAYEPFFKEIETKFLVTDKGKIELIEKKEELKKIK